MNIPPGFQAEKISDAIEVLGLNRRAFRGLKRERIHTIADVIIRGRHSILEIRNIGNLLTDHIFVKISNYLNVSQSLLESGDIQRIAFLNAKKHSELVSSTNITENSPRISKTPVTPIIPTIIDLSTMLAAIVKSERTLRIIELRANQLLTLEVIAAESGGVTRERIRQIIDQIHEKIRENLNLLKLFCDYFEERTDNISKGLNVKNFTINDLVNQCKLQLPNQRLSATGEDLETLIAITRLLAIHDKAWAQEFIYVRWKNFFFLACVANPPIKGHDMVSQTLAKEKLENKKMSYKELALSILSNEKRPMHWSEIAEQAYHMRRRDSFNSTALYNALMNYPELFVRVDAGTYALAEWGFSKAETYPDIIASILKSSKKPLSADAIYHKVNEVRQVKRSTLIMSLEMHPRFYKSLENTYGLRVWLPPREKQTLRTPERLVEDSDSYNRLEQASQRGYDIENMIQADIDNT